jgi:hypothetical protein
MRHAGEPHGVIAVRTVLANWITPAGEVIYRGASPMTASSRRAGTTSVRHGPTPILQVCSVAIIAVLQSGTGDARVVHEAVARL